MRVTCTSTPEGNIYRVYRTDMDAYVALKPIVPFLLASHADVIIGTQDGEPDILLRVGPIGGSAEAQLLSVFEPYLTAEYTSDAGRTAGRHSDGVVIAPQT
jgi:hypothetical protein